jgi:hypothetical protein
LEARRSLDDPIEPQELQHLLLPSGGLAFLHRVDMEGALIDFCWGWDAGGNQARPTVEKRDGIAVLKTRSDLLPGALIRFGAVPPRRAAALVTASDRLGHAPDEQGLV